MLLRAENIPLVDVPAYHALEMTTHSPPVEGTLALVWEPQLHLVQLVHALPFEVSPERLSAVEHAIVRINDALAVPGFGFNSERRLVYYRLVLPRHSDGSLEDEDIKRAISTVLTTLGDFWLPLDGVIRGGEDADAVVAAARKAKGG
ncbi:MAG TPA: YbjN domain-containing protein [Polyangia bacterium]|jgi:hypothetical protein|nr:YbjN domain-containing protein [Polyangia bacterium]